MKINPVREIYSLIKGTISKNNRFAELNKHRIVINDLPKGLKNKKIKINPQYFSEAMSELIINALKFSKAATNIIIMVYSQNNTLRISVINDPQKSTDGTIGIPEEYEKVIFEPFYRISKLVYERYNTLDFGIGLTFVEKIVTRHGGEIFAENIIDYSDITKDPQVKVNLMISLPFVQGVNGGKMPFVNVMVAGPLTKDQKKALAQKITTALEEVAGKDPKTTYVVFEEVDRENWAAGGKLLTENVNYDYIN